MTKTTTIALAVVAMFAAGRTADAAEPCVVYATDVTWNLLNGGCRDGKASGQGIAYGEDGRVYRGGFVDGRFDGIGLHALRDGTSTVGRYAEGRLDGLGRIIAADDRLFLARWHNGARVSLQPERETVAPSAVIAPPPPAMSKGARIAIMATVLEQPEPPPSLASSTESPKR